MLGSDVMARHRKHSEYVQRHEKVYSGPIELSAAILMGDPTLVELPPCKCESNCEFHGRGAP